MPRHKTNNWKNALQCHKPFRQDTDLRMKNLSMHSSCVYSQSFRLRLNILNWDNHLRYQQFRNREVFVKEAGELFDLQWSWLGEKMVSIKCFYLLYWKVIIDVVVLQQVYIFICILFCFIFHSNILFEICFR